MALATIDEGIQLYYELTGPEDGPVVIQFGNGEEVEVDLPVVTNCGYYEGLDGPPSIEQCERDEPAPTTEG